MPVEQSPHVRRCREENDALVLEVLNAANGPLSAYEIAHRASSNGQRIVPNQAYRTLARLIERQAVVRIETLSAYIARQSSANVCLICKDCHTVEFIDVPGIRRSMVDAAPRGQFAMIDGLVEANGQCLDCQRVQDC